MKWYRVGIGCGEPRKKTLESPIGPPMDGTRHLWMRV